MTDMSQCDNTLHTSFRAHPVENKLNQKKVNHTLDSIPYEINKLNISGKKHNYTGNKMDLLKHLGVQSAAEASWKLLSAQGLLYGCSVLFK